MKIFFLTICLLISICANGQESRKRYVLWATPTGKRNVSIDGVAIGLMAHPSVGGHLQIRGLNLELIPLAVFTLPGSMFATMLNPVVAEFYATPPENVTTDVRGISISGGMFEEVAMGGVSLSINSYVSYSDGLEMSMFMNSNYRYSGAQLAMFGNRAVEGSGLQLGMFNSCQDCRGIQIGFLNRMGNRVLPIINFNFPKRNKSVRKHSKFRNRH